MNINTGITGEQKEKSIDFYTASYCSICHEVKPFVMQKAQKYFYKLNFIDVRQPEGAAKARERAVVFLPTLEIFEGTEAKAKFDKKSQILDGDFETALGGKPILPYLPEAREITRNIILGSMSALGGIILIKLLATFGVKKD